MVDKDNDIAWEYTPAECSRLIDEYRAQIDELKRREESLNSAYKCATERIKELEKEVEFLRNHSGNW